VKYIALKANDRFIDIWGVDDNEEITFDDYIAGYGEPLHEGVKYSIHEVEINSLKLIEEDPEED